jgi:hypothetical protein
MAWASDANVKAKAKAINLVIASLPLAPHKLQLVRDASGGALTWIKDGRCCAPAWLVDARRSGHELRAGQ